MDTGAYSSSIHCDSIEEVKKKNKKLIRFVLQDPFNYPQVRYTKVHKDSHELSDIIKAPVTICIRTILRPFRETAIKKNKPIIVFEGGESSGSNEFGLIRKNLKPENTDHYEILNG